MSPLESSRVGKWFGEQDCDPMQIFVLFENIPGISFFVKDTNHRLLFMNRPFLPRALVFRPTTNFTARLTLTFSLRVWPNIFDEMTTCGYGKQATDA